LLNVTPVVVLIFDPDQYRKIEANKRLPLTAATQVPDFSPAAVRRDRRGAFKNISLSQLAHGA
jgi:hypothetical protein